MGKRQSGSGVATKKELLGPLEDAQAANINKSTPSESHVSPIQSQRVSSYLHQQH